MAKAKTTWEMLVERSNKNLNVNTDNADALFFDEMPKELKAKKIGDKAALGELGEYRKTFHSKFSKTLSESMADHVKDNDEINTMDATYTTPDKVTMGVGFARPTGDATEEEWGESFSFRQSLPYEESITTDLRKSLGLKFKPAEDK